MVEGLGVSQIFALLPAYLRQMGVPEADRLAFIGLFSALIFVVGMPLVPLWGVWADKYSRKAVIVRSALVEAVVFAGVALSQEPWQLALVDAAHRVPAGQHRRHARGHPRRDPDAAGSGRRSRVFGASGPIGFAVGPILAGILIDGFGWSLAGVFWLSAALSVGTALLVAFGSKEVRPEVVPTGSVVSLAFGAVRGVLADPSVRRIFVIFGVVLPRDADEPAVHPDPRRGPDRPGPGLCVGGRARVGTAALVGGLVSPLGGVLGDRIGFRPVLVAALAGAGVVLLLMPFVPSVASLALLAVVLGTATATVSAMVFGLLALEVPPERRSATLNLVYLPLYAAGIIGPAIGAGVASVGGASGPFIVGGAIFLLGAVAIAVRLRSTRSRTQAPTARAA